MRYPKYWFCKQGMKTRLHGVILGIYVKLCGFIEKEQQKLGNIGGEMTPPTHLKKKHTLLCLKHLWQVSIGSTPHPGGWVIDPTYPFFGHQSAKNRIPNLPSNGVCL